MRFITTLFFGFLLSGQAVAAEPCNFLRGSVLSTATDRFSLDVTAEALSTLRQQYYPQGFLNSLLQQSCALGEPLSSQIAFIVSSVSPSVAEGAALNLVIQNDDQLIPYSFGPRVATVWIAGVEKKIKLPQTAARIQSFEADPAFDHVETSRPEVRGAAWFAVAKLSEKGQIHSLNHIISAGSRFESGIVYRLTLDLTVNDQIEIHEVTVLSQPWIRSFKLLSDVLISETSR